MVPINIIFYFKRDADGDDAPSGYSIISPPNVNLTLYGSDFSGRQSHTKLAYVTVRPVGNSSFLVNYIMLVARTQLSIPLASLTSSFSKDLHHVSISFPNNKLSIVSFPPCLFYTWT